MALKIHSDDLGYIHQENPYTEQVDALDLENTLKLSPDLIERLNKVKEQVNSAKWQQQKERYQASFIKKSSLKKEASKDHEKIIQNTHKFVLFISSSMPLATLRRYAKQLDQVNGVMVLRGGIGGIRRIQPTLQYIKNILVKDPNCQKVSCDTFQTNVLIDPKLFVQYQISKVPALIHTSADVFESYCQRKEAMTDKQSSYHVIYGDASLSAMILELAELTEIDELQQIAEEML